MRSALRLKVLCTGGAGYVGWGDEVAAVYKRNWGLDDVHSTVAIHGQLENEACRMPTDQNRFVESTKATLAKRAGYICSNPACLCLTSGPHSDDSKAVILGEAAHIRGANPGSARYDPAMKPTERRSITNAIWLRRNCAKLIDSDVHQYTVEFIYQWKRKHEQEMRRRVHGADWPGYLSTSILSAFEDASPAARQIVVDQPDYWEYMLTVELLRTGFREAQRQLRDLEQGLCFEPARRLFDDPSAEGKYVIDFEVLPPRKLKKVSRWVGRLAKKYA